MAKWINCEKRLPEEGGDYVVRIRIGSAIGDHYDYITTLPYSPKHKAWNTRDEYSSKKSAELCISEVTHWMAVADMVNIEEEI